MANDQRRSAPSPRPGQQSPARTATPPRNNGRAVTHTGDILTAADVERSITRISDQLEDMVTEIAKRAESAARAEAEWKRHRAQSRMRTRVAGGYGPGGRATEDECDDQAMKDYGHLLTDYLIKEALYASLRDAMFTRRTQLEALRTVAANIRAVT